MKYKDYIYKILGKLYTIFTEKPYIKVLEKQGLKIGENLNVQNGVIIDKSHCWLIEIGNNVTLAPRVHILAHDASTKQFIGYTKIGRVIIGNNVFVGAGTTILPNVKIGDNVIIGANSVASKDVESNLVIAGNPAKKINTLDDYLKKFIDYSENLKFDNSYTIGEGIDNNKKMIMNKKINGKIGLVK